MTHTITAVGRSTLLRAIGEGLVVGFPSNLHALYVDQLKTPAGQRSVLDFVMDAAEDVVTWRQQAHLLQVIRLHKQGSV